MAGPRRTDKGRGRGQRAGGQPRGAGPDHRRRDDHGHGDHSARPDNRPQGDRGKGKKTISLIPGYEFDLAQLQEFFGKAGLKRTGEQKGAEEEFVSGSMVGDLLFTKSVNGDQIEYRAVNGDAEFVLVYPAMLDPVEVGKKHTVMIIDEGKTRKRMGADKKMKEVKVFTVILADTDAQVNEFKRRVDAAERAVAQEPKYARGEVVTLNVDLSGGAQREIITTAPDGRVVVIHNPLLFQYASGTVPLEVRIIRGARKGIDAQYEAEIVAEKSIATVWATLRNGLLEWEPVFHAIHDKDTVKKVDRSIASEDVRAHFNQGLVMADGLHAAAEGILHEIEQLMSISQTPTDRRGGNGLPPQGLFSRTAALKRQADTALEAYEHHMRKLHAYVEEYVQAPDVVQETDAAIDSLLDWMEMKYDPNDLVMQQLVTDPADLQQELDSIHKRIDEITDPLERERLRIRLQELERYFLALAYSAAAVGSYDAAKEARGGDDYQEFSRIMREAGFTIGLDPVIRAKGEHHSFDSTNKNISVVVQDRLSNFRVEKKGNQLVVFFDIDGEAHDNALNVFQRLLQREDATADEVRAALDAVYDSNTQHCTVDDFLHLLRTKTLVIEYASVRQERLLTRFKNAPLPEFIHLLNAYREEIDLSGRRESMPEEEKQFIEQVNQLTIQRLREHLQLPGEAVILMSQLASHDTGILAIDITVPPDIFTERAVLVTGLERPGDITALARRIAAAIETHEKKKVEGGVALREGLKGTVDDIKKLSDILFNVPIPKDAKTFQVIRAALDSRTFALVIEGVPFIVNAEIFSRLQEESITITEGPVQFPENALGAIEECNEQFGFNPPLRLGEVFVFDYHGKEALPDPGLVSGIRLILCGYERGNGTAEGGHLRFYYADAVDARGELNTDFSITHGKQAWKTGGMLSTYSVAEIMNALELQPPEPRMIRAQTRRGVHGELSAEKPRAVTGADLMVALELPQETIEGRKVIRFQWNGESGQDKESGRTLLARGDVCRVIRWNDTTQEVEVAVEAKNGLLIVDNIHIPYHYFEQYSSDLSPAPTVIASEGELNRQYYKLLELQDKKLVLTPIGGSILEFLNNAADGKPAYIYVRREQIITVPKKGEQGQTEKKKMAVTKALHFHGWNEKEVVFSFSDETIRRRYSIPDFFAALEDPTNLFNSTEQVEHAYQEVPEQQPRIVGRDVDVERDDVDMYDEASVELPDAESLPKSNISPAEEAVRQADQERAEFLTTLNGTYHISEDDLLHGLIYNGTPVVVSVLDQDDRKLHKGDVLIKFRSNGEPLVSSKKAFRRRGAFTMTEFIDLIDQKQIIKQVVQEQSHEPDRLLQEDEKNKQFFAYIKREAGIDEDILRSGLYFRGEPITVLPILSEQRERYGDLGIQFTEEKDQFLRAPLRFLPFTKEKVTYNDFIRLLNSGDITVGPDKREKQPKAEESPEEFEARKEQFLREMNNRWGVTEADLSAGNVVIRGTNEPLALIIADVNDTHRTHDVYRNEKQKKLRHGTSFAVIEDYFNNGFVQKATGETFSPAPETAEQFLHRKAAFLQEIQERWGITEADLNSGTLNYLDIPLRISIASDMSDHRPHDVEFDPVRSGDEMSIGGESVKGMSFEEFIHKIYIGSIRRNAMFDSNPHFSPVSTPEGVPPVAEPEETPAQFARRKMYFLDRLQDWQLTEADLKSGKLFDPETGKNIFLAITNPNKRDSARDVFVVSNPYLSATFEDLLNDLEAGKLVKE